jgi:hypothetical protein
MINLPLPHRKFSLKTSLKADNMIPEWLAAKQTEKHKI